MQNGIGWKSALIWGFPAQLPSLEKPVTYSFWIWAPSVSGTSLLPPTRFYCGTMQNGTGWNSALIWGFPAQLPSLEKPVTYSFWIWAPSVSGTCPVAPTRFYCGTMQNGTGWKSALIWGFPAQLPSLEKPVTYSFWIWAPLGFGHLPCCPQLDFIVELCRMALDENPH